MRPFPDKAEIQNFYAHGKLLLTGEYFVLDGAKSLALPSRLGQSLSVKPVKGKQGILSWKSYDQKGEIWFKAEFTLHALAIIESSDQAISAALQKILKAVRKQNPSYLHIPDSWEVETHLEFPRLWGLGTSSTLVYNLAQWAKIDPFQLLEETFGGSGYDLACAGAAGPIIYQKTGAGARYLEIDFAPPFREQLYFVYLGKKQNSREGIKHYREHVNKQPGLIKEVSSLTEAVLKAGELKLFIEIMKSHENLIAKTLKLEKVQDVYFRDFPGLVKSLGAWGGDFVLVAGDWGNTKIRQYFNEKGFKVFLPYKNLILEK